MNKHVDRSAMPTPALVAGDGDPPLIDEASLERQMDACDLSPDTRRFLRNAHLAEKQLNSAYSSTRQAAAWPLRVSQVYRELFGDDGDMPPNAPDPRVPAADGRHELVRK